MAGPPARPTVRSMSAFRAVVCGGGIAAAEGLLRLRALAGDQLELALIAPNEQLVYRPLAVREPFAFGPARRYPLRRIARDSGAEWTRDELRWVDPDERVAHTGEGKRIAYDALLIAIGAREVEAYRHVATFRDADADAAYRGIVQDIEQGYSRSLAFVQPAGPVWPLPLYELALMTAQRAESMDIRELELTFVTPEPRPLAVFGTSVSEVVANRLARAGIAAHYNSHAKIPAVGRLQIEPRGLELHPQRIVTIPRIAGPAVPGLPGAGAHGFLPIDKHCAVPATDGRVFAAGDAAHYPIKHGGLGTQMADTAAAAIAKLAGASTESPAFNPVIRGKLLTGTDPIYISAHPAGTNSFQSQTHDTPPWPQDDKVIAEELGPYLTGLDTAHAGAT